MVGVTNTLIITNLSLEQLDDPGFIETLQQELITHLPVTETTKFIILRTFKRVIIIFQSHKSSLALYNVFKSGVMKQEDYTIGFSLQDTIENPSDIYLGLPNNSRMFLISPPASPPVDFDYDQVEEEPNKLQIYTHEDIQKMFLENNQELKELLSQNQLKTKYSTQSNTQEFAQNPTNINHEIYDDEKELHHHDTIKKLFAKEIVLNDSDSPNKPKIILNPINGENDHLIGKAIRSFKTSLPPKSIFDDLDDDSNEDQ